MKNGLLAPGIPIAQEPLILTILSSRKSAIQTSNPRSKQNLTETPNYAKMS